MGDTQNGQDEQTVSDDAQVEWEGADIDTSKLVGDESRTVRDEAPGAGDGGGASSGDSADVDADADAGSGSGDSADADGTEVNDG